MSVFTGAGVAIITPFKEDFSIDFEAFAELIEYQIANSTDAIIVMGTTGESATTTIEEHIEAIRFCVETVKGRVPVVAGTGSNATDTAIHLSVEAERCGVDALLVVSPYYNKATQNGLYSHYKAIADSVKLPIILYNVPSRTGCNILPETVVKLCTEVENIVGVKEASGNISQIAKLFALADGKVDVYSGNDDQIVPILSFGGKGVISVLSNVAPKQTHDICQLYFDGKTAESAALQIKAIPLVNALFCEVNPIPVKKGAELMGFGTGRLRMPLTEIEPAHEEMLKKAMAEFGCEMK